MLIEAKYRGIVASIRPILDAMTDEGFWLGEPLRRAVLDAVRE